jgi:limonene-1,2-epoxide hydrolase
VRCAALLLLPITLAIAGCGSGDEAGSTSGSSEREITSDADPAAVRVIDAWATTLRQGDIEGAARYFAIPSIAENAGTLIRIEDVDDARLTTRGQVEAFNQSLPCGAKLTEAVAADRFTVATFVLTERPGPGLCGAGTGNAAQTAFVIEDGQITEWRRVAIGSEEAPSRST